MNRDFKINLVLTAFMTGVAIASRIMADSLFYYVGLLMAGILIVLIVRLAKMFRVMAVILLIIGLAAGAMRVLVDWNNDRPLQAIKVYGEKVELEGKIANSPVLKDMNQQFYLLIRKITFLNSEKSEPRLPDGLLVRVKLAVFPELHLGDEIRVAGTMLTPENSEDFNYADYLMKDHVYWMLGSPGLRKILKADVFEWWDFQDYLFWLRGVFLRQTYSVFSEPAGGIMAGTLIGDRANIAANILANFQITGLTHILAISGFNISLIINLIGLLVAKRGRWMRFVITILLIAAFVIVTGGGASVLRAALMGSLVLAVRTFGRSSQILKIILLSGFLMTLINPRIVDFDISFQLSFFATMSLIIYADEVVDFWEIDSKEEWMLSKSEQFFLKMKVFVKEGVMTTIAAQIMTLPIMFYNFGTVSLISPLSNLVVAPFVPLIMLSGFMTVMLSFLSFWIGAIPGAVGSLLVMIMLKIVELMAKLPLASISLGKGLVWLAIIYYLLVFKFFHKYKQEPDSFQDYVSPP